MKKIVLLCVGTVLASGCATSGGTKDALLKRAPFDLDCPAEKLQITELGKLQSSITYGVKGCGSRATYIVQGDWANGYQVILNTDAMKDKKK